MKGFAIRQSFSDIRIAFLLAHRLISLSQLVKTPFDDQNAVGRFMSIRVHFSKEDLRRGERRLLQQPLRQSLERLLGRSVSVL